MDSGYSSIAACFSSTKQHEVTAALTPVQETIVLPTSIRARTLKTIREVGVESTLALAHHCFHSNNELIFKNHVQESLAEQRRRESN